MFMRFSAAVSLVVLLSGCLGIPPLNTATISTTPAPPASMAKARQLVSACAKLPDVEAMFADLSALGYNRLRLDAELTTGPIGFNYIKAFSGPVKLYASPYRCEVGVVSMTPEQSLGLAQPWARAFGMITNAEAGNGLSDHVVQAWRSFTPERNVYVSADKTWNYQSRIKSDLPGATVRLSYQPK